MKISATTYLHGFALCTMFLALVRCATGVGDMPDKVDILAMDTDSLEEEMVAPVALESQQTQAVEDEKRVIGTVTKPHRILSVPSYKTAFPDSNSVQLEAAQRFGVTPVANREDAERRKQELVFAGANPYFSVDPMRESIPYLVPRATVLLQDIGRAFFDSLYVKGVPLHQIIVTSALRTEEDVARLRRHNGNASENSAHRYGTTFDICYNRYVTVQTDSLPRRKVQNDTLKWVLSEVLRDMRERERCYIKYEVKQGCFHITTR